MGRGVEVGDYFYPVGIAQYPVIKRGYRCLSLTLHISWSSHWDCDGPSASAKGEVHVHNHLLITRPSPQLVIDDKFLIEQPSDFCRWNLKMGYLHEFILLIESQRTMRSRPSSSHRRAEQMRCDRKQVAEHQRITGRLRGRTGRNSLRD